MKGVFLLVLSCCFALSWQQRYPLYWSPYFVSPYHFPYRPYQPFDPYESLLLRHFYNEDDSSAASSTEVEPRRKSSESKGEPSPENRAFGVLGLLGYNYVSRYLPYTITATSYVTATANITVGSIVTCFLSTIFADAKKACRRKRDQIVAIEQLKDLLKDEEIVSPSAIEPVLPTARFDDETFNEREKSELLVSSSDITSSMVERAHQESKLRRKRLNIRTSVITSTTTSTLIVTSAVTTTLDTAFASAGKVSCVPTGWKVC